MIFKNQIVLLLSWFMLSCTTVDTSQYYGEKIDATNTSGYWSGYYVCAQGRTAFDLVLQGYEDGIVQGEFYFYPTDSNPNVPTGRFSVEGSYHQNLTLIIRGDQWLEKPFGYSMINIEGKLNNPFKIFYGTISGSGCSTFYLEKIR